MHIAGMDLDFMFQHSNNVDFFFCSNQLRCSGIIEAATVQRAGYPFRILHEDFVNAYSPIYGGKRTLKELLSLLEGRCRVFAGPDRIKVGRTKVFLGVYQHARLTRILKQEACRKIGRFWKRMIEKLRISSPRRSMRKSPSVRRGLARGATSHATF